MKLRSPRFSALAFTARRTSESSNASLRRWDVTMISLGAMAIAMPRRHFGKDDSDAEQAGERSCGRKQDIR